MDSPGAPGRTVKETLAVQADCDRRYLPGIRLERKEKPKRPAEGVVVVGGVFFGDVGCFLAVWAQNGVHPVKGENLSKASFVGDSYSKQGTQPRSLGTFTHSNRRGKLDYGRKNRGPTVTKEGMGSGEGEAKRVSTQIQKKSIWWGAVGFVLKNVNKCPHQQHHKKRGNEAWGPIRVVPPNGGSSTI